MLHNSLSDGSRKNFQLNAASWNNIKKDIRKALKIEPEYQQESDLKKAVYHIFLCVGHKECLSKDELAGLILQLNAQSLSYVVHVVPKNQIELDNWQAENQETIKLMKNSFKLPKDWRKGNWLTVQQKFMAFLDGKSKDGYVQHYQQKLKDDYHARYSKEPSESVLKGWAQEANAKYAAAHKDISKIFMEDVSVYHKKHLMLDESEIKEHILLETIDWLTTGQGEQPAVILYKNDLFKTMNKAKRYADVMDCSPAFLCKPKIKFEELEMIPEVSKIPVIPMEINKVQQTRPAHKRREGSRTNSQSSSPEEFQEHFKLAEHSKSKPMPATGNQAHKGTVLIKKLVATYAQDTSQSIPEDEFASYLYAVMQTISNTKPVNATEHNLQSQNFIEPEKVWERKAAAGEFRQTENMHALFSQNQRNLGRSKSVPIMACTPNPSEEGIVVVNRVITLTSHK